MRNRSQKEFCRAGAHLSAVSMTIRRHFAYRLALIESAQRELIMTTFDMSDGESVRI